MYFSPICLLFLTFTVYVESEPRIIGGSDITIDKCPYQLSLQKNGKHVCGATIISKSWAVTAASCVKGATAKDVKLRAGSNLHKTGGTLHEVKKMISHASYNEKTNDYNIALIEVTKTFDSKTTKPIELSSEGAVVAPGTSTLATGWGVRSAGGTMLTDNLQQVSLPLADRAACAGATVRQLCAGYTSGGRDVCDGDWGGPLVAASRLLGVATKSACGRAGSFGVYTSVPAMRAWIKTNSGV